MDNHRIVKDLQKEIELLEHLKQINYSNDDMSTGIKIAYDIAINRIKGLIKKYE